MVKRQDTNWEKIPAIPIINKGLISQNEKLLCQQEKYKPKKGQIIHGQKR